MKKILSLLAISTLIFSCNKKDEEKKSNEFAGTEVQVYSGKAWTNLTLDNHGDPKQLALVLNNDLLNSVPVGGEDHPEHNTFIVPVHQTTAEKTPFKFIMLNWNPNGHEPDQIYTLPHFDMHFFTTPVNEVMNYTDMTRLENNPPADYIPVNHLGGAAVPMMGKHWVDLASPELTGQTAFTQTFIYGSYDSKVVFYEPMITLNFLKNTNDFDRSLPQPAKFKTAGFYPTRMKIKKKSSTTEIILDGFTYRQAS